MLQNLTPMLESHDLEATIQFYTDVLGFTCDAYEQEWGWASLSKDQVKIMFTHPNPHRNLPKAIMSGSLYINTDMVDSWWEKLKAKCAVCYELEQFEYGMKEFAVYDNNGYLLQFGQAMEV